MWNHLIPNYQGVAKAQSPDMNLIEMVWQDLKRTGYKQMPANLNQPTKHYEEDRTKFPPQRWSYTDKNLSYWDKRSLHTLHFLIAWIHQIVNKNGQTQKLTDNKMTEFIV